tara:strand:+ start:38 stop:1222 length:1185 start_codon:yes stop_codon:yes gene_type:complete
MSTQNKYIIFGKPNIGTEEINYIRKVFNSKWIGTGPITEKFEKNFKNYKKTKYSLSVNSCTAALHLSLVSLNLKKGDEVITTPMTFASTINSIILAGGKPVLADINEETFNIDPDNIIKKITKKTKGIILVHLAGLPCEMKKINKIVKKNNLFLIEDCAHSIESKYENKHVGNFGDTGCFSFYSTKNLTTGEGGMIITKRKQLANRIKILRLHGLSKDAWKRNLPDSVKFNTKFEHYDVKEIGLKYNMIDINSAIGIIQLKKIEKGLKARKKIFNVYKKLLSGLPVKFQKFTTDTKNFRHAYHLCIIKLDNKENIKDLRDKLVIYLRKKKIGIGITYRSVTDMTIFKKKFGWNDKTCAISKKLGDNLISLPIYPTLKYVEQKYICECIKKFFKK